MAGAELLCPWNFPGKTLEQVPFPTPGDLPDPGIESSPLVSPALAGRLFTTAPPGKPILGTGHFRKSDYPFCLPCPASAIPN